MRKNWDIDDLNFWKQEPQTYVLKTADTIYAVN